MTATSWLWAVRGPQPTVALRDGSAARLCDALLATALGALGRDTDPRDLMVGLALHSYVARQLGLEPPQLFDRIATWLPDGPVPGLLREFGSRKDVTLDAFGWQVVQTEHGPDSLTSSSCRCNRAS